jgi:hypothetical protein
MSLDNTQSSASARISQELNIPDYFSCQCCNGSRWFSICEDLRREGRCAKDMLAQALASGAVRVVVHTPAPIPSPVARLEE